MDRNSYIDGRSVKLDRPTKLRAAYRATNDENSSYDRIKTEPDYVDIRLPSGSRLDEIKGKYGFKRDRSSTGLTEINSQNLSNLHNLRIREVDSPINSLQKGRQNFQFASGLDSGHLREPSIKTPGSVHEISSNADPRIQNIDKINSKIKNILNSFDRIEQELMGNHMDGRTRKHSLLAPQVNEKQAAYQKDFDKRIQQATQNARNNNNKLLEDYYSSKQDSKAKGYEVPRPRELQFKQQSANDRLERRRPSSNYSNYFTSKGPTSNSQSSLTNYPRLEKQKVEVQPLAYQTFKKQNREQEVRDVKEVIQPRETREYRQYKEQRNKKDEKDQKDQKEYKDFKMQYREKVKEPKKTQQPKEPTQHIVIEKTETKRLFKALKRQVELDEQYRNKKYAFKQIKDEDKLSQLISQLVQLGVRVQSRQQLLADFKISEDEFNPFYTCRADTDYASIAKAYAEAKQHWQKQIIGAFKRSTLQDEGFSEQSIDLDRKGYMTVEDFVRLLNLEADAFVRNRDLVLIYRRLTTGKHLKFNDLLQQINSSQI